MKILILMPLDEKWTYMAEGIYKALPQEVQDITFAMPMFMDYLVNTKTATTWLHATFDAIVSGINLYKTAVENNDDLIIIGNIPSAYEFDAVFNFQDMEQELPYEDKTITEIKGLIIKNTALHMDEKEKLLSFLNGHIASESIISLINCGATADFIAKYIKTKPDLESIEQEYQDKLAELKRINKGMVK